MILYGVCWREFLKEQIKDIIISSLDGEDFPRTLMRDSPDGTVESDRYRQETLDLAGGVLHPIPGLELSPLASHSGWSVLRHAGVVSGQKWSTGSAISTCWTKCS
jgi:hypothetical protein